MKRLIFLLLLAGCQLLTGCRCELSPQILGNERISLHDEGNVVAQGCMDEFSSDERLFMRNMVSRIIAEGRPTVVTYAPRLCFVSEGWTLNCQKDVLILTLRRTKASWIQLYCPMEQNERLFISRIKETIAKDATGL